MGAESQGVVSSVIFSKSSALKIAQTKKTLKQAWRPITEDYSVILTKLRFENQQKNFSITQNKKASSLF